MPAVAWWLRIGYWFYANTRFGKWYFNKSLQQNNAIYPLGHSAMIVQSYDDINVGVIPYCKDNYGFVVWRGNSKLCIVIDPGYYEPIGEFVKQTKLQVDAVLLTHKHYDHCNDVNIILALYPSVKVFSNRYEKIRGTTDVLSKPVTHIKNLCGGEIDVVAHLTPGHTIGHTVYSICTSDSENIRSMTISGLMNYQDPLISNKVEKNTNEEKNATTSLNDSTEDYGHLLVFSGDCIFLGAIGTMFEGSMGQTLNTLEMFLKTLIQTCIPTNRIMIFPAHEYAVNTLPFIMYNCTPYSSLVLKKLSWCEEQRNWQLPTIPTTLLDELSYSPFLRIPVGASPKESRICIKILENNQISIKYMPNLLELIKEMMLSNSFIKVELEKGVSNISDYANFKFKLFSNLFDVSNKSLLCCERCAPDPLILSNRINESPEKVLDGKR